MKLFNFPAGWSVWRRGAGGVLNLLHPSWGCPVPVLMNDRCCGWQMSAGAHFTAGLMLTRTNTVLHSKYGRPTCVFTPRPQRSYTAQWKESSGGSFLLVSTQTPGSAECRHGNRNNCNSTVTATSCPGPARSCARWFLLSRGVKCAN